MTVQPERLSAREQTLWHAIKTLSEQALIRVAADIEASAGISGSDFSVLSRIEELGNGELSQHALGRALGWQRSRLSHQLTRMEKRQLLTRESHSGTPAVWVRLSIHGLHALAEARPAHATAVRAHILRHVPPDHEVVFLELADRLSR